MASAVARFDGTVAIMVGRDVEMLTPDEADALATELVNAAAAQRRKACDLSREVGS